MGGSEARCFAVRAEYRVRTSEAAIAAMPRARGGGRLRVAAAWLPEAVAGFHSSCRSLASMRSKEALKQVITGG